MSEGSLGNLMSITMQKIREMIDVNTIVGTPISTPDGGTTIIPVSKVCFGFGSGGTDHAGKAQQNPPFMFGGGSGAGVNIIPVSFLVITDKEIKLLPVTPPANTTVDRVVELVPDIFNKISDLIKEHTPKKPDKSE